MTTVLTSSIPTVIDALLKQWRALELTNDADDPVAIFDGLPGPQLPDLFVQIGGVEPYTADGTQDWASLGSPNGVAPSRDERYTINCYVSAYVGGVDAGVTGDSDAQKRARDQAHTVLAALETAVRNDPKLVTPIGGSGLGTGWVAFGGRVSLEQTTATDAEAGKGRTATFAFQIEVFHRLYTTS